MSEEKTVTKGMVFLRKPVAIKVGDYEFYFRKLTQSVDEQVNGIITSHYDPTLKPPKESETSAMITMFLTIIACAMIPIFGMIIESATLFASTMITMVLIIIASMIIPIFATNKKVETYRKQVDAYNEKNSKIVRNLASELMRIMLVDEKGNRLFGDDDDIAGEMNNVLAQNFFTAFTNYRNRFQQKENNNEQQ